MCEGRAENKQTSIKIGERRGWRITPHYHYHLVSIGDPVWCDKSPGDKARSCKIHEHERIGGATERRD